jgi:hypothetical protein
MLSTPALVTPADPPMNHSLGPPTLQTAAAPIEPAIVLNAISDPEFPDMYVGFEFEPS